jgi:CheY-like chemotaxis protein
MHIPGARGGITKKLWFKQQGFSMDSKNFILSGMKILVIDDEPDILDLTKCLLTFYHANVIAAATAAEGLEQVQTHRPDVIVSDIGMPHRDGYQFIREVRNLPAHNGGQTPAIALTAFNGVKDRSRALNAGFQRHLSKPFELQELIDIIASMAATKSY